jgi:para-nitrobenzyl esterase
MVTSRVNCLKDASMFRRLATPVVSATALLAAGALPAAAQTAPAPSPVSVKTIAGVLNGTADAAGIMSFKGIPYAQPPVGELRWKPAVAAKPSATPIDATKFGPACLQKTKLSARELAASGAPPAAVSEDCLTLNIWAPAKSDKPLPVMVWLHGGGHTAGSGSLVFYDGTSFARDGVILVSINYRLGLLGYFAHPALTREAKGAPAASYGTTDQLEALRWVQRNIAALGGDPTNVTVFGESAGAQSTLTLLTTPAAQGLFAKAIVQSGYIWGRFPTLSDAETTGAGVAKALGLPGADATPEQLRGLSGEALIAAQEKLPPGPIVDGRLLPEAPVKAFAAGRSLRLPLMLGTNSNEGSLVAARDPASVLAEGSKDITAAGKAYYKAEAKDDATLGRKLWRDWSFTVPTRWVARQTGREQPTFLYRFDYVPERWRTTHDGVDHGLEIPFVFDSWAKIPFAGAILTDADKAETAVVHGCWVSFAKTGAPSCPGAPAWPRYNGADDTLMYFGPANSVKAHLDTDILDAVERARIAEGKLKP